ncbi:MAG TPA: zinc-dependent metalloprotease [Candidatus Eremiobacteraceae bacterium]|nr:zinc-dependent metalloprotease [Candidatus Eremiobacteraceae bacterium]
MRYSAAIFACIAMFVISWSPQPSRSANVVAIPVSITPVGSPSPSAVSAGDVVGAPYERFKENAESQPGLFTVWRKSGRVYFELAAAQFDTPYLLVPTLVDGMDAQRFLVSGVPFGSYLLRFHRTGERVIVFEDNPYGKAKPGTPAALSVANSYPPSAIAAVAIASVDKATGNVVIPADFLLTDINDVTSLINNPFASPLARYSLNPTLGYYGPSKAFPKNVEVETDLTWSSGTGDPTLDAVPDSRYLFLKIHDSILELPDDGYRPRLADDRVGYFLTARRQYDNQQYGDNSFEIYINRWNVEKSDPNARVSPAKNPIVYYILNEVPVPYRAPVRDAILEWNKAFEAVGITHAIEVRQQPDDPNWDPDDARYSIVRWATTSIPAFSAFGPSITNPLTGEIFRGEVVMDANIVRAYNLRYTEIIDPTRGASAAERFACQMHDCDLATEVANQRDWAVLAMQLDGRMAEPSSQYTNDSIKQIVLHEFGHTLGLRHNFGSEVIYTMPQVQSKTFARSHGIVGSVMAYTPVNLSPHGQPQGELFMLTLGPWDYAMIKYGYEQISASSPEQELPTLRGLAATYTQPDLHYSTDEDAQFVNGFATDPRANPYDLTNDPLLFARNNLAIDQRMFNLLLTRRPQSGDSYEIVRRDVATVLANWYRYTLYATTYMGGEYFTRNHKNDPNAKTPFIPMPRTQERQAYELLDHYVFGEAAFGISPQLLNSMGSTRYNHWQSDPNDTGRLDFPLEVAITNFQTLVLRRMFDANVLARLDSMELRTSKPGQTMSLADLFDWTYQSVYGDLAKSGLTTIGPVQRSLQYRYADLLAHIALRPDPGTPSDARALARHQLASLSTRITQTLNRDNLDEVTQANLEAIRSTADRALSAQVITPAP